MGSDSGITGRRCQPGDHSQCIKRCQDEENAVPSLLCLRKFQFPLTSKRSTCSGSALLRGSMYSSEPKILFQL